MSTLMTVRMFNEYGCPWPFFGPDSLTDQQQFPLPPGLTERVLRWTRDFDVNYHEEKGWPSVEHRDAVYREGLRLAQEVREAVGPNVKIEFEFWETTVTGGEVPL